MKLLSRKNSKGFTLIELLVAISIVGLLATISFVAMNTSRIKGRDVKRKADLRQIKTALEMYYDINGKYPPAGACDYGTNCYVYSTSGNNWLPSLAPFLDKQPVDPVNNLAGPWIDGRYSYSYGNVSANGQIFDLVGQLENTNDFDRCEVKQYRFYLAGTSWCGSYSKYMYSPQ